MDRFFVESDQIEEDHIYIRGQDVRHISGALRLEEEDELEVVSQGQLYICNIDEIMEEEIRLNILEKKKANNEPEKKITLYQGLAKGSRMDYVIQKGTEVGITEFYSVMTERSIVRLNNKRKIKSRLDRWQKIADEAGKQCKRDILPEVKDILDFEEMLDILKDKSNILVPYEEEEGNSIREIIKGINSDEINIVIGPEGGFSESEIDALKEIGGKTLSLGPRIFRTETAGLVTAAIIFYEFGDI